MYNIPLLNFHYFRKYTPVIFSVCAWKGKKNEEKKAMNILSLKSTAKHFYFIILVEYMECRFHDKSQRQKIKKTEIKIN